MKHLSEKTQFPGYLLHITEAFLMWGGKVRCIFIDYFLGNILAKNFWNRFMCVKVIPRRSSDILWDRLRWKNCHLFICDCQKLTDFNDVHEILRKFCINSYRFSNLTYKLQSMYLRKSKKSFFNKIIHTWCWLSKLSQNKMKCNCHRAA